MDPLLILDNDKFPSACIKLAEFFEEWLNLDNVNKNLNKVVNNALDEQHGGIVNRSILSNLIQPPRSPGKKSPKKRSHDESSNSNNNSHHRNFPQTAIPCSLNVTSSSSSLSSPLSSSNLTTNRIHLDDVRNDVTKSNNNNNDSVNDTNDNHATTNTITATIINHHDNNINNDNNNNNSILESSQNVKTKRRSNYDSIPVFYRPGGINGNRMRILRKENDLLTSRMTEIESFFKPFAAGYPIQTFVHVTKRLCNFPSYFNLQLCKRII